MKGYCVSIFGFGEKRIREYVKWQLKQDKTVELIKSWK